MVSNIKIPKKSKSKNISIALDLVERVSKAPKTKKIKEKEIESINESIAEVDKLLKTPKKGLKKLIEADKEHLKFHPSKQDYKEMKMDQKAYKHKATNVSNLVTNYVSQYKSILSEGLSKGSTTKAINKIRDNFYQMARPSDISDANSLIKEIKDMLPKEEPKPKKAKGPISDDDKKYKQVSSYIKKHIKMGCFPSLKDDEEAFKYVIDEAMSKGFKRLSKPFIQSILDE
jgi:hypothetical protein